MSINSSEEEENFVDAEDDEAVLTNKPDDEKPMIDSYPLHRAIIERESLDTLKSLLKSYEQENSSSNTNNSENGINNGLIGRKDRHGNTPLHLAVMLGNRDLINLLLLHNAPIKSRNLQGWTPLDEAISYGDRKTIKTILRMGRKQARQTMDTRRPKLIKALKLIKDFQMELRWEFYSWLPLVKRFLPSDTCRIAKKGSSIRLDTTLVDFSDRSWQRGNITFLFNGEKKPGQALAILDNELKVYQNVRYNESLDIDEDVDILMSSDIIYPQMSTKSIAFSRAQAGWFFSRYNKTEKVGQFEADFYNINGLAIESKKRREHLTEEDVQSNKAILETFKRSLESTNNKQHLVQQSSNREHLNSETSDQDDDPIRLIVDDDDDDDEDPMELPTTEQQQNGIHRKKPSSVNNSQPQPLHRNNSDSASIPKRNTSSSVSGAGGSFDSIVVGQTGAEDYEDCFENCAPNDNDDEQRDEEQHDTLALVSGKSSTAKNGGTGAGGASGLSNLNLCIKRRKSLQPPPQHNITWEEYLNAPAGKPPCLGRQIKSKESTRNFKATLAMSKEFPLSIESLLNVLEVIAPFKHFKKLREFIKLNLPPGFPVKIDIPIIPTVLARVTFLNFQFTDSISDSLFDIPSDYSEDPNRFPDV